MTNPSLTDLLHRQSDWQLHRELVYVYDQDGSTYTYLRHDGRPCLRLANRS